MTLKVHRKGRSPESLFACYCGRMYVDGEMGKACYSRVRDSTTNVTDIKS